MKDLFKLVGALVQLVGALLAAVALLALGIVRTAFGIVGGIVGLAGGARRGGRARTTRAARAPAAASPRSDQPEWMRRKQLPKPPSVPEYHAAGVSPDVCTLCQKRTPERAREWRYMLFDGRPTVICPTCWRKNVTNNTDAAAAAFEARISTRVWTSPRYDRADLA